ncbi:MAG: transposase [Acidobacteriaceae bacterium]|jgi:hypothetical protein
MPKGLYRCQNTGDLHFITISCHRHAHILKSPEACNTLQRILEETRQKYIFQILGYVFMSNHIHLLVPALLEGSFGSRKWMAARLGAQGGKARSLAKRTAARANGALGGRPRKSATR